MTEAMTGMMRKLKFLFLQTNHASSNMNGHQNHLEIIEKYITAYNAFDTDEMLRNLHDDIYFENINDGQVNLQTKGIAEFKNQAEIAKQLFQKREQKILNMKFNDNIAEVQIEFTGILSDDPANGLQAGTAIRMTGDSVFVFNQAKIFRITDRS